MCTLILSLDVFTRCKYTLYYIILLEKLFMNLNLIKISNRSRYFHKAQPFTYRTSFFLFLFLHLWLFSHFSHIYASKIYAFLHFHVCLSVCLVSHEVLVHCHFQNDILFLCFVLWVFTENHLHKKHMMMMMLIIIVKEIEHPQKIKETTTKTRHKNIFRISFLTIFFLCLLHTATGEEMLLWEESIHNWKSDIIWSEEQGKRIEASREVWVCDIIMFIRVFYWLIKVDVIFNTIAKGRQ